MSANSQLFNLIRSLSKTEKGYFKKMYTSSTLAKKNQYLELFDVIDLQQVYEEEKVKKHFSEKELFHHFSAAKNYLVKMIMKSLVQFHSGSSIDIEIHELLIRIELLYNKGLYELTNKDIKRAERLIETHDKFSLYPAVAKWKKLILDKEASYNSQDKTRDITHQKEVEYASKSKNMVEYYDLAFSFTNYYIKTGDVRDQATLTTYRELIAHPLLQSEEKAMSTGVRFYYHNIHALYNEAVKEHYSFHWHNKRLLELMEQNPSYIENNIKIYIPVLYNCLLSSLKIREQEAFTRYMKSLKNVTNIYPKQCTEEVKREIAVYTLNAQLRHLISNGKFNDVVACKNQVTELIHAESGPQYPLSLLQSEFYYLLAYGYFGTGQYQLSAENISELINHYDSEQSPNLLCLAKILNLLCHYEMGNFQFLDYNIESVQRFLSRSKQLYTFEKTILGLLKKLIWEKDAARINELFLEYNEKLQALKHDPFDKVPFEYFDFIGWTESHLSNKTFEAVSIEKRTGQLMKI